MPFGSSSTNIGKGSLLDWGVVSEDTKQKHCEHDQITKDGIGDQYGLSLHAPEARGL